MDGERFYERTRSQGKEEIGQVEAQGRSRDKRLQWTPTTSPKADGYCCRSTPLGCAVRTEVRGE